MGAVPGLSAAGMTSGLAALGLCTVVAGIGVVAAIPIGTGLVRYGAIMEFQAYRECIDALPDRTGMPAGRL